MRAQSRKGCTDRKRLASALTGFWFLLLVAGALPCLDAINPTIIPTPLKMDVQHSGAGATSQCFDGISLQLAPESSSPQNAGVFSWYEKFLAIVLKESSLGHLYSQQQQQQSPAAATELVIVLRLLRAESPLSVIRYTEAEEKYELEMREVGRVAITCYGYFSFVRAITTLQQVWQGAP